MKYTIQVRGRDLYKFNLNHQYRSFQGVIQISLFVMLFAVGIYALLDGSVNKGYPVMMFILLVLGALQPVMLKKRCEAAAARPEFSTAFTYEFSEEGFLITQGEAKRDYAWKEVLKLMETKSALLIYMDKVHALILPKDQLNGEAETLRQFIETHVKAGK